MNLGLIILAGGKSSRMGTDKAFLHLKEKTLIGNIIDNARLFGFSEIIIVTNNYGKYKSINAKLVKDIYPGLGPLSGIHAGLTYSDYVKNFVIPCDMPFIDFDIVNKLLEDQRDSNIVVPKWGEKYQPLSAIYTKECIEKIEYLLLKTNEKSILKLFDLVKTNYVQIDFEKISFFNINTPNDFYHAKKLVEIGGSDNGEG